MKFKVITFFSILLYISSINQLFGSTATHINALKSMYLYQQQDSLVAVKSQKNGVVKKSRLNVRYDAKQASLPTKVIRTWDFKAAAYGNIPEEWTDIINRKPSRNWIVDESGYLRYILKNRNSPEIAEHPSDDIKVNDKSEIRPGLIAVSSNNIPVNVTLKSKFKKTEDASVFFGLAGRIRDKDNFYAVIVLTEKIMIVKIKGGELFPLTELALLKRYSYPEAWELTMMLQDDLITGILHDAKGNTLARADARDGEYTSGSSGLYSTDYAGAANFSLLTRDTEKGKSVEVTYKKGNTPLYNSYKILKPVTDPDQLNTPIEQVASNYDIVVAGAGTGGWAAAVQAARLGKKVLLVEETDWIGGQMSAAGVTTMDEDGPLVRERGIYREFHESMAAYYYGLDKCPFMAYYWGRETQNQQEGGYEPRVARNMLYGFIKDARERSAKSGGKLDLLVHTRVIKVSKEGNVVTGAELHQWNESGPEKTKIVKCKVLVDATEHGDVIPLTGAPYRVGNTKSEDHNLKGVVQDFTFTGVIREYPNGVPQHLQMHTPPPNYATYRKKYLARVLYGDWELHNGARMFRAEIAWRGMADTQSPLIGKVSQKRHTLAGLNGGNDYPVTVATVESREQRAIDEREGVYRTLAKIYYLQNELGVPWAVAEDQGYNTPYNRYAMKQRGISDSVLEIAKYLPQLPYVRESRRIEGIKMLVADDLKRGEDAVHVPTSIAIGDYFMDLHGTYDAYEKDLDRKDYARTGGAFQVPFEAFIPRELDGFLPAEKNFSQSRLVNGATRLQPITMLTGEAVGTIASLAVEKGIQPRKLKPLAVQIALLEQGSTLIPRYYNDIDWGSNLWEGTQLLSLYKIWDKPSELKSRDGMEFAPKGNWQVNDVLSANDAQQALKKLAQLLNYKVSSKEIANSSSAALSAAELQKIATNINAGFGKMVQKNLTDKNQQLKQGDFVMLCLKIIKEWNLTS